MPITRETVQYVSHLSRIELTEEELRRLSVQLGAILDFIDALRSLDVQAVPPTSHVLDLADVVRPDAPRASLPPGTALANAPARQEAFFAVPKVIE